MDIAIGTFIVLLLTAATAFFVAQEFAYVAVDRSSLRNDAEKGDRAARRALHITERLSFVLSGAQLGITLTAILVGFAAEPFIGSGVRDILQDLGLNDGTAAGVSTVLTILFATVVQMILGELIPKNWAIARSVQLAKILSRPTTAYLFVAGPIVKVFDATATRLLRSIGIDPVEELTGTATPDDLSHIISDSVDAGVLDAETSQLLQRGLDFHERRVRSAMIPRIDVVSVHADEPASLLVELLDAGHSRFPVLGKGTDDLIGTVSISDLATIAPVDRSSTPIADICTEALVLPESISLSSALEQMRAEHRQLACITDEYGAFTGVITLEDIAEELVGEIQDEDDPDQPTATRNDDGSWTLPARWRMDQIAEVSGIELPENEDYETCSGIVLDVLGRLPEIGDHVEVDQVPPSSFSQDVPMMATITVLSVDHGVADMVNISSKPKVEET